MWGGLELMQEAMRLIPLVCSPIYNGFAREHSLFYYMYFVFCGFHIAFSVYVFLGIPSTGSAGLLNTIQSFTDSDKRSELRGRIDSPTCSRSPPPLSRCRHPRHLCHCRLCPPRPGQLVVLQAGEIVLAWVVMQHRLIFDLFLQIWKHNNDREWAACEWTRLAPTLTLTQWPYPQRDTRLLKLEPNWPVMVQKLTLLAALKSSPFAKLADKSPPAVFVIDSLSLDAPPLTNVLYRQSNFCQSSKPLTFHLLFAVLSPHWRRVRVCVWGKSRERKRKRDR